ncbi:hypothetical protein P053_01638 [Brucella abortus 01-4165]|uniref:Binding-protein-dependent transport systems inner membrane component n=6 Tax=Brucella TaxID=234 RepID=Q2YJL1_BRUA2|nr:MULTISPECIES: ABC transporter permease [Brucella]ERM85560.1 peptide ABC transporter permease [Brucella abortus 82]ERT78992.1 hypothetical protein P050_03289 [Brucella abortus 90-12178]ERT98101.1 hypothetical protein P038_02536 [Brucella abortus 99-9971-135]ERU07921.1 hypothetical protein P039_01142 [Brucella abortus 07-0994-2411]KFH23856.1 peptide ABC transporter permease [Brucella abortus LMN1]KFH24927.1 peptide ABC transporter permease [Brucella abortus LMN2]
MVALSNTSARQFKIPVWFTLPLLIGILVVGFWLIATFLAPYMTPYDPLQMADRRLQIPSWSHWLGTDALGRDVLARTLYGARHSLPIALVVVVSAVIIGALAGAVAGYRGGWVDAAIAAGAGSGRILFKHILPLCWTPVLISATMDLGQVILLAASLSFIGLGATPPTPEWGSMIAEGAVHFYNWWIAMGPGLAILTIVLGFNFIGDGLRDYFDPRSK